MFLQVEGEVLINVGLVEKVEFAWNRKTATLLAGGMVLVADSAIAYRYFTDKSRPDLFAIVKEG